jgi:hypothetical protein
LDANRWMGEGGLAARVHQFGGWLWANGAGAQTSSTGYEVCTLGSPALAWNRSGGIISADFVSIRN